MTYDIFHETIFRYNNLVSFSHNIARLRPKEGEGQRLLDFKLDIDPEVSEVELFTDMFGNTNHHLLLRQPHKALTVTGHSKVQLDTGVITAATDHLRHKPVTYAEALKRLRGFNAGDIDAKQFLFASELIPIENDAIRAYALHSFLPQRPLYDAGVELMERVFNDFEFVSGFSDITTPVDTIFAEKKGVCQDFAHFMISALRAIGLPARYVSGYIETLPPEGKEKLFGADASHAWVSLYVPGAGWLQLDPTNNIVPVSQHVILGYGRDFHDVSPLKGVVRSSGESHLEVRVDVRSVEDLGGSATMSQSQGGGTQTQMQGLLF